jgi:hypothetical protein
LFEEIKNSSSPSILVGNKYGDLMQNNFNERKEKKVLGVE